MQGLHCRLEHVDRSTHDSPRIQTVVRSATKNVKIQHTAALQHCIVTSKSMDSITLPRSGGMYAACARSAVGQQHFSRRKGCHAVARTTRHKRCLSLQPSAVSVDQLMHASLPLAQALGAVAACAFLPVVARAARDFLVNRDHFVLCLLGIAQ